MNQITPEWQDVFQQYEDLCGFEPFGLEDILDGSRTAKDVWSRNCSWLEMMTADVINISTPGEDDE